jgi:hypothetical protein
MTADGSTTRQILSITWRRAEATKKSEQEGRTMNDDEMQRAVDSGAGKPMCKLPDAPVSMQGEIWSKKGDDWVAIESADTIAFLRDADRRMALADRAVDDIESS